MMELLRRAVSRRVGIYKWQKANSLRAKGKVEEALEICQSYEFEDGLKQVVLVQCANSLYRMGEDQQAMDMYKSAIISEKTWGKRKNGDNSLYIVLYSELYFDSIVESQRTNPDYTWMRDRIKKLKEIPASASLKKYYLPLSIID